MALPAHAGSPFAQYARLLWERGYSPIPLAPRDKRPCFKEWSDFCKRRPSHEELSEWERWRGSNIGICLGEASGIVAVDLDHDINDLHARILSFLPESPCIKRGMKGLTAFYRYSGEASRGYGIKKERVVDILSTGRQTVIPPSVHPDTLKPYEWDGLALWDINPADLPAIPASALSSIKALFWANKPISCPQHDRSYLDDTTDEDVGDAISYIHPDCTYEEWYQVGMALKHRFGDKGFALWDQWSSKGSKYPGSGELQKKWHSFNGQGVTIATLFFFAMAGGFIPRTSQPDVAQMVEIIKGGNLDRTRKPSVDVAAEVAPTLVRSSAFPLHLLQAPGLVGRIAKFINDTSIYPQPVLALGCAIAAAGVVMGHKVQSETGLRSNIYAMGIAPSGGGKEHAPRCIDVLFGHALEPKRIIGEPASGAGLLAALREAGGAALLTWDEIGRAMATINQGRAPAHLREISAHIIKMFSKANATYRGTQYANHDGKMPRRDIEQPCLGIYGTTVPGRFFQALTSEDAIDGFLSRWLLFESKEYALYPVSALPADEPPPALVAEIREWFLRTKNAMPSGNLDSAQTIKPFILLYDDEARDMVREFQASMRKTIAGDPGGAFNPIYSRAAEHAIKLALTGHEGETITGDVMQWAIEMATYCSKYLMDCVREHISSNEAESELKKVMSVIKASGAWVRHSALVRKTQWLRPQRRNEILMTLIETGQIEVQKNEMGRKPFNEYRYSLDAA